VLPSLPGAGHLIADKVADKRYDSEWLQHFMSIIRILVIVIFWLWVLSLKLF
jgi:flagellar biogenesis protein FliO